MAITPELLAALARLRDEAANLKTTVENTETLTDEQVRAALLVTLQEIAFLTAATIQIHTPLQGQPAAVVPAQLFEMDRQAAINRIWTESHLKGADERSKLVVELGMLALRSVFLVNGAAIVSLLTFMGNVRTPVDQGPMRIAFGDFSIGLVVSLIAMGLGYIAQQLFSHSEYDKAGAVYTAVIKNEPERPNAGQSSAGLGFQIAAFGAALASLLFFCHGAFAALSALFS